MLLHLILNHPLLQPLRSCFCMNLFINWAKSGSPNRFSGSPNRFPGSASDPGLSIANAGLAANLLEPGSPPLCSPYHTVNAVKTVDFHNRTTSVQNPPLAHHLIHRKSPNPQNFIQAPHLYPSDIFLHFLPRPAELSHTGTSCSLNIANIPQGLCAYSSLCINHSHPPDIHIAYFLITFKSHPNVTP